MKRTLMTIAVMFLAAITGVLGSDRLLAGPIPWAGGPVIQNARIILVYWGTPDPTLHSFDPNNKSPYASRLDRFYSQIAGSSYLTRLSEYSTGAVTTPPITNFIKWFGFPSEQVIGGGSFAGTYFVKQNQGGVVETTDIGPELDHEIHIGNLPAPDRNTVYMIHFSKAWQLYLGTNLFGFPVGSRAGDGDFCAYHAAYYSDYTGRAIVYGAVPYQAALQNCSGSNAPLDAETASGSHELIEAITDPGDVVIEGGFLSVGIGADQAWRRQNGFLGLDPLEIADRPSSQSDTIGCGYGAYLRTSPDARDNYFVATGVSNKSTNPNGSPACILSNPIGSLDSIRLDSAGVPHVLGWTLDPNVSWPSIQAHIYFDGPYPYGKGYAVTASTPRPDVNTGTGYSYNHGFDFVVPNEFRDGKTHSVYAYGIGYSSGNNAFLGNSPLTFNSTLSTQSATQPLMIASKQASVQCMDVTGVSTAAGTGLQVYACNGQDNQRFSYHPDTQELKAYNGSSCLDASSGAGRDGDRLIIWPCNGGANQKWTFNLDNGEIRGINGKCLDANNGSVANGSPIQIWTCNGGSNQAWFRK